MENNYDKMEALEHYDGALVSKHIRYNDLVADMLWDKLKQSPCTKGELAERLDWDLHRLMMILSGDDIIDIYKMVHVAGALGYKWEFNLVEIGE